MKNGMRRVLAALLLTLLLAGFTGCGAKLPEGFDKAALLQSAQDVATKLDGGEYAAVCDLFTDDLRASLTPEKLEEALGPALTQLGAMTGFGGSRLVAGSDEQAGDYVTVLLVAKHENGKVTYRVSFDAAGAICGLYMG